jgi:hypothetical protein
VAATQALLRAAGVEALARFAGFAVAPRASYAEAFAHRFPAQVAKGSLTEADPAHLAGPEAAPPAPVARRRGGPADVDLGL